LGLAQSPKRRQRLLLQPREAQASGDVELLAGASLGAEPLSR